MANFLVVFTVKVYVKDGSIFNSGQPSVYVKVGKFRADASCEDDVENGISTVWGEDIYPNLSRTLDFSSAEIISTSLTVP